jgi:hypothetical protein
MCPPPWTQSTLSWRPVNGRKSAANTERRSNISALTEHVRQIQSATRFADCRAKNHSAYFPGTAQIYNITISRNRIPRTDGAALGAHGAIPLGHRLDTAWTGSDRRRRLAPWIRRWMAHLRFPNRRAADNLAGARRLACSFGLRVMPKTGYCAGSGGS